MLDTALTCHPGSPSLEVMLAMSLRASGRPHGAVALLVKAVADHVPDAKITRYEGAIPGHARPLGAP